MAHWKAAERVLRYLHMTKNYMLMYKKSEEFEIIENFDFDFVGCIDNRKSNSGYIYLLAENMLIRNDNT